MSGNSKPTAVPRRYGFQDRIGVGIGTDHAVYYRCVKTDDDGHLFERVDQPGLFETFTHARIADLERTQGFRYDRDHFDPDKALARQRSGVRGFAFLPDNEKSEIIWRIDWCARFVERRKADKEKGVDDIRAVLRKIKEEIEHAARYAVSKKRCGTQIVVRKDPSQKQISRWLDKLVSGGMDPIALRNAYRKCGAKTEGVEAAVEKLMEREARRYLTEKRQTQASVYTDLKLAIGRKNAKDGTSLPVPCARTFFQRIRNLRAFEKRLGRHGGGKAGKDFVMVSTGFEITRPGERIEIDEWEIPLMTLLIEAGAWDGLTDDEKEAIETARWMLSTAIDTATRVILGMRLGRTATSELAVSTLAMVVSDKTRYAAAVDAETPWNMCLGLETVVSDMGSGYVADETRAAIAGCGGFLDHNPAGLAHLRPYIERVFGTFHTLLISLFTGRTFENVVSKGDYDPEKRASIAQDEQAWALVRFVVDAYHNRPHEGLDGETPLNAWKRLTKLYKTVQPPDKVTFRNVFGVRLSRVMDSRGVRILNLHYQSLELQKHRRDVGDVEVEVLFDPTDMGCISVRIVKGNEDCGLLTVPCARRGFDGVHAADWNRTRADLCRRFGDEAALDEPTVLRAMAAIRSMADAAEKRTSIMTELTAAEIDREERALEFAWTDPQDSTSDDSDTELFSGLIEPALSKSTSPLFPPSTAKVSGKASSKTPRKLEALPALPPPPAKPPSKWKIED